MDMEMMEMMHKMKKKLCKQFVGYADVQNFGGKVLEDMANLVKTIKNLDLIIDMEEKRQGGASQRGYSMESYDDASYRRGRDSMGRYTSREDGPSMRGGSYHDGGDEETRRAIQEIKRKLDEMM